jgi:hypothetical protein
MTASCLWCGKPFKPREGGKPQPFCRPAHRRAFDKAARAYVAWAIETGSLSRTELRDTVQNQRGVAPDGQVAASGRPAPRDTRRLRGKGGEET